MLFNSSAKRIFYGKNASNQKASTVIPRLGPQGKGIISDAVCLNLKSFRTNILLYF
jgi:hypothetical protein